VIGIFCLVVQSSRSMLGNRKC